MWPFKRKKKDIPPPPDMDELHSYVEPQPGYYPTAQPAGFPTYATTLGPTFPDIPNQDQILVHWFRPPDGKPPEDWYADRASDLNYRNSVEQINGIPIPTVVQQIPRGDDPRWTPPAVSRVTSFNMPTNGYSMTRPYDQDVAREFNGDHFSMADNIRAYDVGGMNPVKRGRNTYRLTPPTLDATSVDMASLQAPSSNPALYVSPTPAPSNRSYRLGG